jgi:RimJ/RimL family protein N-acetyltransferase
VGRGKIIAEARYYRIPDNSYAEAAFTVDESYHGLGIASHLMQMLIQIAKEQGIRGFIADVLRTNLAMMRVFEKCGLKLKTKLEQGVFSVTMPFN